MTLPAAKYVADLKRGLCADYSSYDVEDAFDAGRRHEREACIATLESFDRTGREWVRGSLWANIFNDAIEAMKAGRDVPAIDWRSVLKRYMEHVAAEESVTYVDPHTYMPGGWQPGELEALQQVEAELIAEGKVRP